MSFVALFYCSLFSVTDVTAAGDVASVNLSLNFLSGFPKAILCEDVGLLEYVRFMTIQTYSCTDIVWVFPICYII